MTTDPDLHAKSRRLALDHAPDIDPVHRLIRQCAGAAGGRSEEEGIAAVAAFDSSVIEEASMGETRMIIRFVTDFTVRRAQ